MPVAAAVPLAAADGDAATNGATKDAGRFVCKYCC